MTNPITPPPGLVQQWLAGPEYVSSWNGKCTMISVTNHRLGNVCAKAAQWGADQELEACIAWLDRSTVGMADLLRAARRPKPSSLKEQALMALEDGDIGRPGVALTTAEVDIIRRALEALDE